VLWGGLGAGALALSSLAAFAQGHALMINASPSLPYWAIWLDPRRAAAARRHHPVRSARLAAAGKHFGAEPKPFGKRVSGVPGDIVTEKDRTYFVNGQAVAQAKPRAASANRWRSARRGAFRKAAISSPAHKDGFDSRYAAIGWICATHSRGREADPVRQAHPPVCAT
jgi:conjugal transfer pilin signal peptidase TrbI